uniref:Uncharacterized protein n=1 Tax=Oryza sativa subsp. japonica TaxID=39947 RepID=Q84ME9_ORYSJ|nr:hypothetical protein Os03g30940 [Oryza sativa Japonica Group]
MAISPAGDPAATEVGVGGFSDPRSRGRGLQLGGGEARRDSARGGAAAAQRRRGVAAAHRHSTQAESVSETHVERNSESIQVKYSCYFWAESMELLLTVVAGLRRGRGGG